ncbi:MAG: hypothetical protein LBK56_06890 [Gracilibacteraceae bacterium]|nr:hypothetical protein [Gracilibacteraceae bacterium]
MSGFDAFKDITGAAREYWLSNEMDAYDYILLLPHDAPCLNAKLRAAFTAKLGGRRGAIIQGDEAQQLLALYSLYAFTDKLIIGSFDEPYGRKLRNLLESGAATEDELIGDVILGALG